MRRSGQVVVAWKPEGMGPTSVMISRWHDQTRRIASGVPMPAARGSPAGPNQWFCGAPVVRARMPAYVVPFTVFASTCRNASPAKIRRCRQKSEDRASAAKIRGCLSTTGHVAKRSQREIRHCMLLCICFSLHIKQDRCPYGAASTDRCHACRFCHS